MLDLLTLAVALALAEGPPVTPAPATMAPAPWASRPPAVYSPDIFASLEFEARPQGLDTTVGGYFVDYVGQGRDYHIDPAKVHVDRADTDGRIERRDVGRAAAQNRTALVNGGAFGRQRVDVPRSMLRAGMQRLVLRFDPGAATRDGVTQQLEIYKRPVDGAFVLVYVPEENADDTALRRFIGADVSTYGTARLRCGGSSPFEMIVQTKPHQRLHVLNVQRDIGTAAVVKSGSSSFRGYAPSYKAIDPVRVTFDGAAASQVESVSGLFPGDTSREVMQNATGSVKTGGCPTRNLRVAGGWDLERAIGTETPAPDLTEVKPGLRRADVAFVLGYPPGFATKADLDARTVWNYERPDPKYWSVVTFAGDRVATYEHPKYLP